MNRTERYLAARLEERKVTGNLRALAAEPAPVDFFSNDYLGIATEGRLLPLLPDVARGEYGSTGSRLLSGNCGAAEELEAFIADFHRAPAALLFNSGYAANTGLLSSVPDRHTTILYDELCHASIIDGIRLSLCGRKFRFGHNDLTQLEDLLVRHKSTGNVLVVVESVYSMDGDLAPLTELAALCSAHDAQLIVDEAHATGVFGPHGEGLVCALGLEGQVFARIHTFGKALGCHGAAVAGSDSLKQYLVNFARPFIYTTALPGHAVAAARAAYQYLGAEGFTNQPLHNLVTHFRNQAVSPGWKESPSAIQAFVTGDNAMARQLSLALRAQGFQANAILHPTVPAGSERLRICLHTFNTADQVDQLIATCEQLSAA